MFPLARFAALRTSALYALLTLALFVLTARALTVAVPMLQAGERAAYAQEEQAAQLREQVQLGEVTAAAAKARIEATHRQNQADSQRGYAAVVPILGYLTLLLYALSAYGNPKSQSGKEGAIFCAGFCCVVFFILAHWATVQGLLVSCWQALVYLLTSGEHLEAKLAVVAMLAIGALCHDLTRRRRPAPAKPAQVLS